MCETSLTTTRRPQVEARSSIAVAPKLPKPRTMHDRHSRSRLILQQQQRRFTDSNMIALRVQLLTKIPTTGCIRPPPCHTMRLTHTIHVTLSDRSDVVISRRQRHFVFDCNCERLARKACFQPQEFLTDSRRTSVSIMLASRLLSSNIG